MLSLADNVPVADIGQAITAPRVDVGELLDHARGIVLGRNADQGGVRKFLGLRGQQFPLQHGLNLEFGRRGDGALVPLVALFPVHPGDTAGADIEFNARINHQAGHGAVFDSLGRAAHANQRHPGVDRLERRLKILGDQSIEQAERLGNAIADLPFVAGLRFLVGKHPGEVQGVEMLGDDFAFFLRQRAGRGVGQEALADPLRDDPSTVGAQRSLDLVALHLGGGTRDLVVSGGFLHQRFVDRHDALDKVVVVRGLHGDRHGFVLAGDLEIARQGGLNDHAPALALLRCLPKQDRLGKPGARRQRDDPEGDDRSYSDSHELSPVGLRPWVSSTKFAPLAHRPRAGHMAGIMIGVGTIGHLSPKIAFCNAGRDDVKVRP